MRTPFGVLCIGLAALVASVSCGDPVQSDAVAALGDEAPGVRTGPTHRPGQPCLTCHTGDIGAPPQWSLGGTVFLNKSATTPAVGAVISFTDAKGTAKSYTTNSAGNFYEEFARYQPAFPLREVSVVYNGTTQAMASQINGSGSCASCHVGDGGTRKMPRLYVNVN